MAILGALLTYLINSQMNGEDGYALCRLKRNLKLHNMHLSLDFGVRVCHLCQLIGARGQYSLRRTID